MPNQHVRLRLPATAAAIAVAMLALWTLALMPASGDKPAQAQEAARLNNLGVAYMNQQLFEKGLKAFEKAAALDPGLAIARLNRAIALLNLGKVEEVRPLLEAYLKQHPDDANAWYNLGLLYKNSSSPELAVEAFRRVTQIDPDDADTWYFLGASYAQLKQFPQASESFEHALKLNTTHASAQFGLARASQQAGDTAKAKEQMARFQYITQNKLGFPISLAYGEQGRYSRAEESPAAPEKVLPAIKVQFVDVTRAAGLGGEYPDASRKIPVFFGVGACFLDYDGDGLIDVLITRYGPEGGLALLRNVGQGKFENVTRQAGLDPSVPASSCTAGDYDNDGAVDLAVSLANAEPPASGVMLLHNEKNGTFKSFPIKTAARDAGLTFIDYDHDGDLDLYVTQFFPREFADPEHPLTQQQADALQHATGERTRGNEMWRNNGNGTFSQLTSEVGLQVSGSSVAAIGTDYNNDRAVDLVVTARNSPVIFENQREGPFHVRDFWASEQIPPANGVTALDFDHDGWMDIAFTHDGSPAVTLWRNHQGKKFKSVPLPKLDWASARSLAAFDYDNDGWVDLVVVGDLTRSDGGIRLFRNLGPDGWKDVTGEVGLDKLVLHSPESVIAGDYDNDGATDLLITQKLGPPVLLRNQGGSQNHWLRLALKGLNDNKSAIGTKVEVFSDGNRQKFEIAGSSGYLGQNSPYPVIGLGQAKQADIVRLLWPTGVLQDEIEVAGDKQQNFTEIDRRGSSCPTLFAWDGHHYELVADMIGAGVVGHWVGPGERNIPRPTEHVKIDRKAIRERTSRLSFRLMEPMEEVVYLDEVKLLAVDHPSAYDVFPDERFVSNPPYPPFKTIVSRDARPPAGAWDDHGRDVLPDLLAHRYFGDFDLLPFKGFTKPHSLTLDLGEAYHGGPLRLLLHGEIEYFTATGMYAADQAGIQAMAPYVEAQAADGSWKRVIDDMGFPAGLPRTMVADLTGKLPPGTRRIRITTNLQIYWDSILIDRTPQDAPVRLTPVPLLQGDLEFHGYPRQIEDQPPGNVKYVYEDVSRTGPYARQAGTYTRYGDVLPLLTAFDDRMVVFGSGEGVELEFDPGRLPRLPAGWVRDYFFMANGYEKDMDFYAAEGNTVDPLPFRAMGTYPYPGKSYPLDDKHLRYQLEYNTRHVSGDEPAGYWYQFSK
jgi:tetratricopeptide (TPR) repeat protein